MTDRAKRQMVIICLLFVTGMVATFVGEMTASAVFTSAGAMILAFKEDR